MHFALASAVSSCYFILFALAAPTTTNALSVADDNGLFQGTTTLRYERSLALRRG